MADEREELRLKIILEVVRYVCSSSERAGRNQDENSLFVDLIRDLPGNVNINSLITGGTVQIREGEMGDRYEIGQVGQSGCVGGRNPVTIGQTNNQVVASGLPGIDLPSLASELRKVRQFGRGQASGEPEEDVSLAEVANAEMAARAGDDMHARDHLIRAGKWALELAKSIGVPVAIKAMEMALE